MYRFLFLGYSSYTNLGSISPEIFPIHVPATSCNCRFRTPTLRWNPTPSTCHGVVNSSLFKTFGKLYIDLPAISVPNDRILVGYCLCYVARYLHKSLELPDFHFKARYYANKRVKLSNLTVHGSTAALDVSIGTIEPATTFNGLGSIMELANREGLTSGGWVNG